jgi:ABC-type amino acid transport substrate-binding protein
MEPLAINSLTNRPLVVQRGTVNVDIAQHLSNDVREMSSTIAAIEEVRDGKAFAAVMDTPFALYQLNLRKLEGLLTTKIIQQDSYGVAVSATEAELLGDLNTVIERLKSVGYLEDLRHRTL